MLDYSRAVEELKPIGLDGRYSPEEAVRYALGIISRKGISASDLEMYALYDLTMGVPKEDADRVMLALWGARIIRYSQEACDEGGKR